MNQNQTPTAKNMYDTYLEQLSTQKANAKNEAYVANENSKRYLDNTLKQQGLSNTGMNETSKLGLASMYQQSLSNINNNYNNDVLNAQQNYFQNQNSELNNELLKMQNQENLVGQYQSLMQQYGNEGKIDELNKLKEQYTNSDLHDLYKAQLDLQYGASNNQADLYEIADKIDGNNYVEPSSTNAKDIFSALGFEKTPFDYQDEDSRQYKAVNYFLNHLSDYEGKTVDLNYGAGKGYVVYVKNGKVYKAKEQKQNSADVKVWDIYSKNKKEINSK